MLDSPQQVASSSTSSISLPSTPSTSSSLMSSPPKCMQDYALPALATDIQDPGFSPASLFRVPVEKPKKVPRPPNSFLLFRSWLGNREDLPPGVEKRQQNVSKIAGKVWRLMDESSKDEWRKKARRLLQDHERKHPPKNGRTRLGKTRKVATASPDRTTRSVGPLSGCCVHDHPAPASTRPQQERASPYKFPIAECSPQGPSRGYQVPQPGSPSIPPFINLDFPSPSIHSLSPLPLHNQPHAFPQGTSQQPLSHVFIPQGPQNHPYQAYEQENGVRVFVPLCLMCNGLTRFFQTVVFSENYAPIYPPPPPSRRYAWTVPVANTAGMMTGPTPTDTTTAMLGLYELNSPYAHFNPNLIAGDNSLPAHQPLSGVPSVSPTVNVLASPLPAAPLTTYEQEVFNAMLGNFQPPYTLENPIPSSPVLSLTASTPAEEASFAESQTDKSENGTPATPQSPATN